MKFSSLPKPVQKLFHQLFPSGEAGDGVWAYSVITIRDAILNCPPFKKRVEELTKKAIQDIIKDSSFNHGNVQKVVDDAIEEKIKDLNKLVAKLTQRLDKIEPTPESAIRVDPAEMAQVAAAAGEKKVKPPATSRQRKAATGKPKPVSKVQNPVKAGSAKDTLKALAEFITD